MSFHFQALGKVIEFSTDIAGQTNFEETRLEMISTMKHVIFTSSEFLTTAKIVSLDPLQSQPRANLTQATRFEKFIPYVDLKEFEQKIKVTFYVRNLTSTINDLLNVYTSAAPGLTECDHAIRAIQVFYFKILSN